MKKVMSTPMLTSEVQYPVGKLVATYKALEKDIKHCLKLPAEHTLKEWQSAIRHPLSEADLDYLYHRTKLSVLFRVRTAERLSAMQNALPSECAGHHHMIAVQKSNQASLEHQLARVRKEFGSEPSIEEPCRHEVSDLPNTRQDDHDNIRKADVLNDTLCLFASIHESLAAVADLAGKISSGLSLVPYGLGVAIHISTLQVVMLIESPKPSAQSTL